MVEVRKNLIKAVADVREHHSALAEGEEAEVEDVVRAVCEEDVPLPHAQVLRKQRRELAAGRVRVEVQRPGFSRTQRLKHQRGGRVGRLVGVELDIGPVLGLLARDIGLQRGEFAV